MLQILQRWKMAVHRKEFTRKEMHVIKGLWLLTSLSLFLFESILMQILRSLYMIVLI